MADHDRHDPELVAAAADREGRLADAMHACADCLTLLGDLRALAIATPGAAIPRRSRDHRLTMEDATRLRRRGWHWLLAVIGTGRDAVTRPLAASLTTLGLVGLMLGAIPAGAPFAAGGEADQAEGVSQPFRADDPTDTITITGQGSGAALPTGAPEIGIEGGPAIAPPAVPRDGQPLRSLALAFLGLGLATFAMRRIASSRGAMR